MDIISGGQGNFCPSDQTTPCTPHIAPIFSIEQLATRSVTPLREAEGVADAAHPQQMMQKKGWMQG